MKLQVTLVKSPVSSKPNHIKIVKALGLHKIRSTKVFEDTPSIRGMIFKVNHLGSVVEISDEGGFTMKLNELKPALGSTTAPRRLGRGVGSGLGKTSGKGHKGAKARSGGGKRPGFEGGQMPLVRQLPKRGFKNIFAKEYATVNVSELEVFENGTEVTSALLVEKKIIRKELDGLKVLGNGELTKKLTVKAVKFTGSAKEKIEAVGGTAEVI